MSEAEKRAKKTEIYGQLQGKAVELGATSPFISVRVVDNESLGDESAGEHPYIEVVMTMRVMLPRD